MPLHLLAESKAVIPCSLPILFNYTINMENFARWFPGVQSIRSSNDLGFAQIGKTYTEALSLPVFGKVRVPLKVVECRPNQFFVTEGNLPVLNPRMEIAFQAMSPNATEIHWCMFTRTGYGVGRLVASPLLKRVLHKRAKIGLSRLAKRMEEVQLLKC